MKLYYLSLSEVPSRAAHSVHVMKMCSAFAALGYDTMLYCRKGTITADDPYSFYAVENDSFSIKKMPFFSVRILGTLVQTLAVLCMLIGHRFCKEAKIYYGRDPFSLCCAAWLGFPVAIELHMPPTKRTWRFCVEQIRSSRRFLGVVCISQGLSKEVRALLGEDTPIFVAHDGADEPQPCCMVSVFEKDMPLRVGYVGSLYEGRGIDFILELASRHPRSSFTVVGGSQEEVTYWQGKTASGNVQFVGFVPQHALPNLYATFDVMLAPYAGHVAIDTWQSKAEEQGSSTAGYMSPLKLFEYMAYGKAFIASTMPAIEEITGQDGEICLLRPYGDINSWSEALQQLEENSALRKRLAEACHTKFLHEYTWRKRAESIAQLWRAC